MTTETKTSDGMDSEDVTVYRDGEDFTIVDAHGGIFASNGNPQSLQGGVFQFVGEMDNPRADWDVDGFGEEIPFSDAPDGVQEMIQTRILDG